MLEAFNYYWPRHLKHIYAILKFHRKSISLFVKQAFSLLANMPVPTNATTLKFQEAKILKERTK